MPHELDQILISSLRPDWHAKLREIHAAVRQATYFDYGDDNDVQLKKILQDVRKHKDAAVAKYTEEFDGVKLIPEQFRVPKEDLEKAHKKIEKENLKLLKSIRLAIENVRKYQKEILIDKENTPAGIKYTPIKRVGICVPGASAPLPSTVIMTAVPAQVAGVKEIVIVSPPRYKDSIHPVTLAVCCELGINEVYRIGGTQAIAALAFGTQTINPVNKIVGPGSRWVQMAKKEVFGFVGINSIEIGRAHV